MNTKFKTDNRVQDSTTGNHGVVLCPSEYKLNWDLIRFDNGDVLWIKSRNLKPSVLPRPSKPSRRKKK